MTKDQHGRGDRVRRMRALSKTMAHALRHAPAQYGLSLDAEGWADVDALLRGIRWRHERDGFTAEDVAAAVTGRDPRRFELQNGRVRALYGHSVPWEPRRVPEVPPPILYHGTATTLVDEILRTGLKRMRRKYVQLASVRKYAEHVPNRRKEETVVVIQVAATDAHAGGIVFYRANSIVWLADEVPAEYLIPRKRCRTDVSTDAINRAIDGMLEGAAAD